MALSRDPLSRLNRILFAGLMLLAWTGAARPHFAIAADPAADVPALTPEQLQERLKNAGDQLTRLIKAFAAVDKKLPTDTYNPAGVIAQVGNDPDKLFEWVRDRTAWAPYQGKLRGVVGMLMDRTGNSLDRSLLLAALLQQTGEKVRLAHATIPAAKATELLTKVRTVAPPVEHAAPADADVSKELAQLAKDYGFDPAMADRGYKKIELESEHRLEESIRRLGDQAPALAQAIGKPAAAVEPDPAVALADHWWVQQEHNGTWIDRDVLLPDATASALPLTDVKTIDADAAGNFPLPANLVHSVELRVIIESWEAGKFKEQTVMDVALRPTELFGQRIVLIHSPLNWPSDEVTKSTDVKKRVDSMTVNQHGWMPVLRVGTQQVIQTSFTDTGVVDRHPNPDPLAGLGAAVGGKLNGAFGGFGGALGGDEPAAPVGKLTAEWIEYEIRTPGYPIRKMRRQIFDLVGPAARPAAAEPSIGEPEQTIRGLSLLGGAEILLVPCHIAPDFVAHLTAKAMVANQPTMVSFLTTTEKDHEKATKQLQNLTPMPSPLYDLAISRHVWSRFAGDLGYDHINVLTQRWSPRVDADKDGALHVKLCKGFDIVENGLALRPGSKADAFTARMEQGVIDTNAEAQLISGCGIVENTAELFDARAGVQWLTVRKSDDAAFKDARISDDVRARINIDLAAGYAVVVPSKPIALGDRATTGWWRVDVATGQTLGMSEIGGGASMAEYAYVVLSVAVCSGLAALDGQLSFQDMAVCALAGAAGAAGGGMFGAGMSMGAKIGVVLGGIGTGIWLDQQPGLQGGLGHKR